MCTVSCHRTKNRVGEHPKAAELLIRAHAVHLWSVGLRRAGFDAEAVAEQILKLYLGFDAQRVVSFVYYSRSE